MGTVYLATTPTGRSVAVKVISSHLLSSPEHRQRFLNEARIAQLVPRHCAAEVLDVDVVGDCPHLVTEFVPGFSLADTVTEHGALPAGDLETVGSGLSVALRAMHEIGIVHRDLKPANVILGPYGIKVIDFGLAALTDVSPYLTRAGQLLGTPAFMAPEQFTGAEVGPPADIFAWGAALAFAASGRPPWGDGSSDEILHRIRTSAPYLEIDGLLHELVRATLMLDPADRPTARAVFERLQTLAPPPPAAGTGEAVPRRAIRMSRADEWAQRAERSLAAGRSRRALHEAATGVAADPSNARCVYVRALAERHLGDRSAALESLELAHELGPDDAEIAAALGELMLDAGGNARDAFAIAPHSTVVRERYVESLLTGNVPDLVRKAYAIDPDHPGVRRSYLSILLEGDQLDIRKAFSIDPDDEAVSASYIAMLLTGTRGDIMAAYRIAPTDPAVCSRYVDLLFENSITFAVNAVENMYAELRAVPKTCAGGGPSERGKSAGEWSPAVR